LIEDSIIFSFVCKMNFLIKKTTQDVLFIFVYLHFVSQYVVILIRFLYKSEYIVFLRYKKKPVLSLIFLPDGTMDQMK